MDHKDVQEKDVLLLSVVSHLSPDDERIVHESLLEALKSNDFRSFERTINRNLAKQPPALDVNLVFPQHAEETCLDIASRKGLTEFVKFLLFKGANPNRVNGAHNRAPVHFAVEGGHVDTLLALLEHPTTNPDIQAGMQTALHIAVKKRDLACATALLQKGASASIPDSKGVTALHDAAKLGHREMAELILTQCRQHPDVDSYRDFLKQTARERIEKHLPDLVPLLPAKGQDKKVDAHKLKYDLNSGDEISFFRDLELAELEVLRAVAEDLLKIAADRNFHEAAVALLKKLKGEQFSVRRAAIIAVQRGHVAILRELLRVRPDAANDLVLYACMDLGMPVRGGMSQADRLECLKLILKENVNVRCTDNKGNTPLHHAVRANCHEAVSLLLEQGSYIGHLNNYGVPPIADMSTCALAQHFNECLQMRREGQSYDVNAEVPTCTNDYKIEVDYRCLMPDDVYAEHDKTRRTSEMDLFKYIESQKSMRHLLTHPLLSSYLYIKWYKIRHFLIANFIFYVVFYLSLNAYVFGVYHVPSCENGTQTDRRDFENDTKAINCERATTWWTDPLWILVAVLLLLFASREFLQIVSCPWLYVKNPRHYLLVALIVLTTALLCGADVQISAVVILISTWELVILISQHPRMSTDIEMFRTVSLKFARFLIPYTLLIVAFALSFYTLFKNGENTHFSNFALSLFKTIIMFSGEFDASDIPFVSHPLWSRVVFILFVLLLSIILLNLLNGLAVSDTAEILSKAELVVQVSRIRLLAYIEDMAAGSPFTLCCRDSRWNPFNFLAEKLHDSLDDCDANNHENYIYVRGESADRDKTTMDRNIIKQAKQIIWDKNKLSENERIMVALNNVQARLAAIEGALTTVRLENNNVNNVMEHAMEA